jgi:pyruvate/2-oxoglutarate dehydrogenase complex dihydrolipoamide acyltransferase (E2) component
MTQILGADKVAGGPAQSPRNMAISPRVRAWCLAEKIPLEALRDVPVRHPSGRISVEDIQRWRTASADQGDLLPQSPSPSITKRIFHEVGVVECHARWDALESLAAHFQFGTSTLVAWSVQRALATQQTIHPELASLTVAVALLRGGLSLITIPRTEADDVKSFAETFRRSISAARAKPSLTPDHGLVLSDMSGFNVRSAAPIVVPPSWATLFVGAPFHSPVPSDPGQIGWVREIKLVLAFDHSFLNGVGASRLLNGIRESVETLDQFSV